MVQKGVASHKSRQTMETSAENWYILFVRTGMEDTLCQFFEKQEIKCFVPNHEVIHRHSGLAEVVIRNLFPGYLFFPSELDQKAMTNEVLFIGCIWNYITFYFAGCRTGSGFQIDICRNVRISHVCSIACWSSSISLIGH